MPHPKSRSTDSAEGASAAVSLSQRYGVSFAHRSSELIVWFLVRMSSRARCGSSVSKKVGM